MDSMPLELYLHPKFNALATSEIYSLQGQPPFLKDRKVRMICPPKLNRPVPSLFDDPSYASIYRIARVPATSLMMFELTAKDKPFITKQFSHSIQSIQSILGSHPHLQAHTYPDAPKFSLWLKVTHIENITHTSSVVAMEATEDPSNLKRLKREDIYLADMTNENAPIMLSFYDDQTKLIAMIKRGDYIGLYNPGIQTGRLTNSQKEYADVILEYTSDTVLFFMSEQEAQLAQVAKVNNNSFYDTLLSSLYTLKSKNIGAQHHQQAIRENEIMTRNEEGFMDCASYPKCIKTNELVQSMLNVTLFGRIVALGNNALFHDPKGKIMDRYPMRIMDETGKVDVTLWEEVGRSARKWREGQYVLLSDLSTSSIHMSEKGPQWYVNGSAQCGTKVFNVSLIAGLLTSSEFRRTKTIKACVYEGVDHWQAEIHIVGWELHLRTDPERAVLSDENESFTRLDETGEQEDQYDDEFGFGFGYDYVSGQEQDQEQEQEEYDPFGHCTRRLGDAIITSVHDACLHPITRSDTITTTETATGQKILLSEQEEMDEKGRLMCEFCRCDITPNQVVQAFESKPSSNSNNLKNKNSKPRMELLAENSWNGWLEWRLDDGTGMIMASGCEEGILNIPAQQFKKMSHDTQVTYLDTTIGKPFFCSLTKMSSGHHRIDRALRLQQVYLGELKIPPTEGPFSSFPGL
ncbi:hypothetical protein J3Q64DRAFT_1754927 [Phycomyces blakesleeanus]|uniref:Replication protein A OB domain-containing protein n=1 Tax=Phycomyces blakesleeanus TaxID=4837 RepID=A0ABR3ATQ8_PHYBL